MSYTLKTDNKIVAYLKEELQEELDKKLEKPGCKIIDYDCRELQEKIEDIETEIYLFLKGGKIQ